MNDVGVGIVGAGFVGALHAEALRQVAARASATATPSRRRRGRSPGPSPWAHFVDCVQHRTAPAETGADGRGVMEVLSAAYLAAGPAGRVRLPLDLDAGAAADIPARPWLAGP